MAVVRMRYEPPCFMRRPARRAVHLHVRSRHMPFEYIAIVAIAIAIYQAYVTVRVFLSARYTTFQRLAQALIIWLFPLFGAIACHIFLASDSQRPRPRDTAFTEAPENPPGAGQHGA